MDTLLFSLSFIMTSLALGGMVFFAAVMAPMVFINLDESNAGKLIRAIFPWYYLYVMITSMIAAVSSLAHSYYAALGLGISAFTAVTAWQVLMPKINEARDLALYGDKEEARNFERLHRLSVWINFLGLAGVFSSAVVLSLN